MTECQAISAVLSGRGVTTQTDQAALLGISQPMWNRHLHGRSPQGATLAEWLRRLAAAGYILRLTCDHRGDWSARSMALADCETFEDLAAWGGAEPDAPLAVGDLKDSERA